MYINNYSQMFGASFHHMNVFIAGLVCEDLLVVAHVDAAGVKMSICKLQVKVIASWLADDCNTCSFVCKEAIRADYILINIAKTLTRGSSTMMEICEVLFQ